MYASVEEGVNSGYLYEVKDAAEEETETIPSDQEEETETNPSEQDDDSEIVPSAHEDVSETVSSEHDNNPETVPSEQEDASGTVPIGQEDDSEIIPSGQEDKSEIVSNEQEIAKSVRNHKSDMTKEQEMLSNEELSAKADQSIDVKWVSLSIAILIAGMSTVIIYLKRRIRSANRGSKNRIIKTREVDYGFIDVHSHIIPYVDDGARSREMCVQMLKKSYEQGIRTIVATPHFEPSINSEKILEMYAFVQSEAQKISKEFQIILANEIYYSYGILDALQEQEAFTIGETRYVLIEFHPSVEYKVLEDGVRRLIIAGYVPIIAHMERYSCLWKKEARIQTIIDLGCYLQINCRSLMGGRFNQRSSYLTKLVKNGMVHFLGTDSHNMGGRMPNMGDCVSHLSKKISRERMYEITYKNAAIMLSDSYI